MNEASRRFKIVDKPSALPGCCFSCRAESRPWFIDLGISFEFHGAAYLCSACFTEIAGMMDFVHSDDLEEAKKYAEEIRNFDIDLVMESLENVSRSTSDSISMLNGVRDYLSPPAPVASDADQDDDAVDAGSDVSPHSGEEGSSEPSIEQGLDDLRASKSSEFNFGF